MAGRRQGHGAGPDPVQPAGSGDGHHAPQDGGPLRQGVRRTAGDSEGEQGPAEAGRPQQEDFRPGTAQGEREKGF